MFYQPFHSSETDHVMVSSAPLDCFHFPLHLHKSYELICVTEGVMRVDIDGESFEVRAGEGALILPNQPHAFSTPEHSLSWLVIFSSDHVPELAKVIGDAPPFYPIIKLPYANLHERMLAVKNDPLRLRAALYELCAIYADGKRRARPMTREGDLACRVVEYIDAHYAEPLTLSQMAKDLGYSYRYMSGVVNRFFKSPLPKVVNQYRVNLACKLLTEGKKEITAIAMLCGFGSMRNFNRSFKELTGLSPREYRENRLVTVSL